MSKPMDIGVTIGVCMYCSRAARIGEKYFSDTPGGFYCPECAESRKRDMVAMKKQIEAAKGLDADRVSYDTFRIKQPFQNDDFVAVTPDMVNHPPHYKTHPSGVECITVTEHFNFCRGNAIKYIWRAGDKGSEIEDLKKARWYLDREIERLEKK